MITNILNRKMLTEKALDAAWLRNMAISQNIANVNTPHYKRKFVSFEEHLSEFQKNGKYDNEALAKMTLTIEEETNTSMRMDGNNVNLDTEMAEMTKNSLRYNALVESMGFNKLKMVIREGR